MNITFILLIILGCILIYVTTKEKFLSGTITNIGQYDEREPSDFVNMVKQEADTIENYTSENNRTSYNMVNSIVDNDIDSKHNMNVNRFTEFPTVGNDVTPYNVDVSDPKIYNYIMSNPQVVSAVKSRFKDYSPANFMRGDVPITYQPHIPLVNRTIQNEDDIRLDGFFTDAFRDKYNKYAKKHYTTYVAGAGQAGGYGGASGGVIMDG